MFFPLARGKGFLIQAAVAGRQTDARGPVNVVLTEKERKI